MGVLTQTPTTVNASSGANVALTAMTFARYVEIQEDGPSANWQGLTVTWPNGSVDNYPATGEPIVIGNKAGALGGSGGPLVGVPANYNGSNNPATTYCNVKSLTATATSVHVTEWN
jgi:hypothetical protein